MNPKLSEAVEWAAAEFERRTRVIGTAGPHDSVPIAWAHPAYRVDWHEICAVYRSVNGPQDRVDFQPLWETAIKKRKLWQVLQGKMHAEEWVQSHPEA